MEHDITITKDSTIVCKMQRVYVHPPKDVVCAYSLECYEYLRISGFPLCSMGPKSNFSRKYI